MSRLVEALLGRTRLVLVTAGLLSATGLAAWLTMPREEDPQFPERTGLVLAVYPGGEAETVERLLVEPIEDHLAEVQEVYEVVSTSRAGIGVIYVELRDQVYNTDAVWDDIEDKIAAAARHFPAGVPAPTLDHELIGQEAVVLSISGSPDRLALAEAAEKLELRFLRLADVNRVKVIGDPGEQVTIEYDDPVARRLGVDPRALAAQISTRLQTLPGGTLRLGERNASLRPRTEVESIAELEASTIALPSGGSVPLAAVAKVRRGPQEPTSELMRLDGETVVGLGIVPRDGIDRVAFGRMIRAKIAEWSPEIAPLEVTEVVFQPDQVEVRLSQLSQSLLVGVAIVAAVLFLAMGLRLGLLVALIVPLVTWSSIAIFSFGGGILHQISIAALVIALGMLVDNAIVVAEAIQDRLDAGATMAFATAESVRELAIPLGSATGTTLAAFVPMLVAKGNTADFTRSIPILIMLTLTVSYLFAILVTPVLARLLLRPRPGAATEGHPIAHKIARVAVRRPVAVLLGIAALVAVTGLATTQVDRQFFPAADRTTVVAELGLPEGTNIERTADLVADLERTLLAREDVVQVASYIGRAAPHFYYNLMARPNAPHTADLVVETRSLADVAILMEAIRDLVAEQAPEALVVPRRLEQGPPIAAPIEIRLLGNELPALEAAADAVLGALRQLPGTRDVRHDLGLGQPTVAFEIDDAAAARRGLSRVDVALALLGRSRGIVAGQYRAGDDPVDVVVRSAAGEDLPVGDLEAIDVSTPGGQPTPLGEVAHLVPEWRPAAIRHRNGDRIVTVSSQVAEGITAAAILEAFATVRDALELPPGVRLELGGEVAESGQANAAILGAVPLGVLLLLFFLLLEFDSVRRMLIILVTVPLAAVGVGPGLLLADQPFGFMSMLGVIALVGIVVNNAIVLLDVIERERKRGATIPAALEEAVRRRIRPILLTMGTTVAGLLPLAFSPTTLWPPLAWAMISGLAASTALTLFAVPALYRLMFREPHTPDEEHEQPGADTLPGVRPSPIAVVALFAVLVGGSGVAEAADRVSLEEAMARATTRPAAVAAELRASAAGEGAIAVRRAATLPVVGLEASTTQRDSVFELETPLGGFALGERRSELFAVEVRQPIFDPAARLFLVPAAEADADAAEAQTKGVLDSLAAEAARRYFAVLAIQEQIATTSAFVTTLDARLDETRARVDAGRTLEAEALALELEHDAARLDLATLEAHLATARRELGRAIGAGKAVDAAPAPTPDRVESLGVDELVEAALTNRSDRHAAAAARKAAGLRAGSVDAERLPKLEARGRFTASSGDAFVPDDASQATLALTWNPVAAFTRAPRRRAADAEVAARAAEQAELDQAITIAVEDAVRGITTARDALAVGTRGVALAQERARVERERYGAGRATANDLLVAETRVRERRTFEALARLDLAAAWVRLDFETGRIGVGLE